MHTQNPYKTNDPAVWLRLKRQESEALLSVVRSITPNVPWHMLVELVVNTIQRQLNVEKILLVHLVDGHPAIAINRGFEQIAPHELGFMPKFKEIVHTEPDKDKFLSRMGVEYVIPLGPRNQPTGWFLIADFAETEQETQNDLVFIETIGNVLEIALSNALLFEEKVLRERIQLELDVAADIQKNSLPSDFKLLPGMDICAINLAHFKVGGDFYDLRRIGTDELFFCIADVAGKGIAAALLVATLQTNLRGMIATGATPNMIVRQLHAAVAELTRNEQYVTIFFGFADLNKNELRYVNAGHNPPLLLHKGEVTELDATCIPVGILDIQEHVDYQYAPFYPGDTLFLYTDGAVEQNDPSGEQLGLPALREQLVQLGPSCAQRVIDTMYETIIHFANGVESGDDISLLVLRRYPDPC